MKNTSQPATRLALRAPFALLGLTLCLPLALSGAADPQSFRSAPPEQPEVLVVQNATIWTSGPEGVLEDADLLVRSGVVERVGVDLDVPRGAMVIDGSGKHLSPGLIDAHSHTALAGGINEGTNITTAEVGIEDVIDAESPDIYRQLAGGLTTANVLHGSANSIGGRNAVIKLRWGQSPVGLLMADAPKGIKFALGENPRGSNQGGGGARRFPQTRAGVEESIRERFVAAKDYRRRWQEYEEKGNPKQIPPRRDLQLEVLLEILDGRRLVHAHSYRADEILMLLRLAEEQGFKISSLQHVLEGYKVADEIAAHGAGASTFSDWWAYKYEVRDAIPYNGAILHDRGVVVSFNSDDAELARRMNLEAAKAVRYGGVEPSEALQFVTLNPAKQLGIDGRVGSLEPGKDADFVVWSGSPLSTYSVVEQTWIDGRRYFDREEDLAMRERVAEERRALIEKVLAKDEEEADADAEKGEGDAEPGETEDEAEPGPGVLGASSEVQR